MEETGTRESLRSQNADWQLIFIEEHLHRVLSYSAIKMSQALFVHLWVSLDFSISTLEATAHLLFNFLIGSSSLFDQRSSYRLADMEPGAQSLKSTQLCLGDGIMCYRLATLDVFCRAAAAASPGNLLEMQIVRSLADLPNQNLHFTRSSPWFTGSLKFENWYRRQLFKLENALSCITSMQLWTVVIACQATNPITALFISYLRDIYIFYNRL